MITPAEKILDTFIDQSGADIPCSCQICLIGQIERLEIDSADNISYKKHSEDGCLPEKNSGVSLIWREEKCPLAKTMRLLRISSKYCIAKDQ